MEFVEPEKAEANKTLQPFSDRMTRQDIHLMPEPPLTVDDQSEVHSSSFEHGAWHLGSVFLLDDISTPWETAM
jgi:hypothetical protein